MVMRRHSRKTGHLFEEQVGSFIVAVLVCYVYCIVLCDVTSSDASVVYHVHVVEHDRIVDSKLQSQSE